MSSDGAEWYTAVSHLDRLLFPIDGEVKEKTPLKHIGFRSASGYIEYLGFALSKSETEGGALTVREVGSRGVTRIKIDGKRSNLRFTL